MSKTSNADRMSFSGKHLDPIYTVPHLKRLLKQKFSNYQGHNFHNHEVLLRYQFFLINHLYDVTLLNISEMNKVKTKKKTEKNNTCVILKFKDKKWVIFPYNVQIHANAIFKIV